MTHDVIVVLAWLGVAGQALAALCSSRSACSRSSASGRRLRGYAECIWGYELWLAFLVSATATAGQPLLLGDRELHSLRALLVPADLHVPGRDRHSARGDRKRLIALPATCSPCR